MKPKKANQGLNANKNKVSKKDLAKKKKEMYKSKEKLVSNTKKEVDENVVFYKEGMTIGDLAKTLGIQASELIKKLFMLGILATVNNKVDFDNASLLVAE